MNFVKRIMNINCSETNKTISFCVSCKKLLMEIFIMLALHLTEFQKVKRSEFFEDEEAITRVKIKIKNNNQITFKVFY